ncbi:ExeA family protein [Methylococcus geothermalis]|uniref:AAA family ATPase n=1 Tax=Methylococcus geothermalis TaxID=2681310 RepID=A0A858Q5A8_9GAMM|nr:AAA family ATPase [Methylococcus geothermalis]QJD28973.1 AAA family ATPase [Methylococcus geothermalis]
MYTQFFRLNDAPFSIAPNPRFLYPSAKHREALAHLLYGIKEEGGGFVALTGEVGTGKTTLCRCLIEQLPDNVDVALILNPRLDALELLAAVCDELHIAYPRTGASLKILVDALNEHLLAAHAKGRRTVLVIDEAQNLSFDVLEQVRLLTNLETSQHKLLQIILIGQPELTRLLEQERLRQLAQRITARYHLSPLTRAETVDYIRHRLTVSGCPAPLFTPGALAAVHRLSGGIPRLINIICDRALLGAYAQGKFQADRATVRRAAREVLPSVLLPRFWRPLALGAAVAVLIGAAALLGDRSPDGDAASSARQAPSATPAHAPAASPQAAPEKADAKETLVPAISSDRARFEDLLKSKGVDEAKAFARLFALWKLDGDAGKPCETAERQGLRCLSESAGWPVLRLLNHPAVLEFALPGGEKRFGTLTGIVDGSAMVDFDGESAALPLAESPPFWEGRFTLLWRPPVTDVAVLKPGQSSPAVKWLRQRFPAKKKPADPQRFDEALKAQVAAFQKQHGLIVDGAVGPHTFIVLTNEMKRPDIPRLD